MISKKVWSTARKGAELGLQGATPYRTIALAEYRLGRWTESLVAGERALVLARGEDIASWFILALARWQSGDKDDARTWFDKAAEWTKENAPDDADLRQLWTEAGKLLGRPGPGTASPSPKISP